MTGDTHRLVFGFVATCLALLWTWLWGGRKADVWKKYGFALGPSSLKHFLSGLLLGSLIILAILAMLLLFSPLTIKSKAVIISPVIGYWFVSLILFAYLEEVVFRGLPMVELVKRYGLFPAQLMVALAFALYHIVYGWQVLVVIMGPLLWSFIFGLARYRSNGIAMPTGLHIALNAGQVLLGMQSQEASLYYLDLEGAATPFMQSRVEMTGIAIQVAVGLLGLGLTFRYQRRNADIAG